MQKKYFRKKGFALGLVLKVRVFGARRKRPIANKWFLAESVKQLTVNALPNPWCSGDVAKMLRTFEHS